VKNKKEFREAQVKILEKITKFRKKHATFIFCMIGTGKRAISFQQNIFVCNFKCSKKCRFFELESHLCRDLGCQNWRTCALSSQKVRQKYCKDFNLVKDRDTLRRRYRRAFTLANLHQELKLNSKEALKTFNEMEEKKKENKNGKILSKKDRKSTEKNRVNETSKYPKNPKIKKTASGFKKKRRQN